MSTKKQYWDFHVGPDVKKQITTGAVAAYISAGITLLAAMLLEPFMLIDALVMLGLGLGLHMGKSRACAVILLGYFVLSKIIQIVSGTMNLFALAIGIAFISMFVMGVKGTYTFYKEWKQFELEQAIQSGQVAPGATSIAPPPPPYGVQPQQPQQPQTPPPCGAQAQQPQTPPPAAPVASAPQEPMSFADQERKNEQDQ